MSESSSVDLIERICVSLDVDAKRVLSELAVFEQELVRWQNVKNLVSRETLPEVWSRHFLDSIQLASLISGKAGVVLDYGSGGGFPAIPIAIVLKETDISVHMVEANGRKCSFLRHVVRLLDLNCTVHNQRAESLELPENAEVIAITARAFADLSKTFEYCISKFSPETVGFMQKGRGYDEEISASKSDWQYDLVQHSSVVAADSVILEIRNLQKRH